MYKKLIEITSQNIKKYKQFSNIFIQRFLLKYSSCLYNIKLLKYLKKLYNRTFLLIIF